MNINNHIYYDELRNIFDVEPTSEKDSLANTLTPSIVVFPVIIRPHQMTELISFTQKESLLYYITATSGKLQITIFKK